MQYNRIFKPNLLSLCAYSQCLCIMRKRALLINSFGVIKPLVYHDSYNRICAINVLFKAFLLWIARHCNYREPEKFIIVSRKEF